MEKWEYRAIYFSYNEMRDARGKKYFEWVIEFSGGTRIEGLQAILDAEAMNGWELVNIVTEYSVGTEYMYGGARTKGYRAFFKRKAEQQ